MLSGIGVADKAILIDKATIRQMGRFLWQIKISMIVDFLGL
ncbi:hypothetical protein J2S04_002629 [Alicyclobacillus tengchongensis]|uniref:Uncharacterized protein n=1 Tax=Alicyclobacillus tolerans TaxID=90970 RepID=A0ABT9LZF4_9BACL|nr:hypothetical protein [Alicyclobacillus tengchongensis]